MIKLSKSDRINKALKDMSIFSYRDVIFHLPRRYDDLHETHENNLIDKERIVFVGRIASTITQKRFKQSSISKFSFVSRKGNTFFVEAWNRPYLSKSFSLGDVCTLIGSYDIKKNIINLINISKGFINDGRYLKPIYSLNSNIDNFEFQRLVQKSFKEISPTDLWNEVPSYFMKKYKLMDKYSALYNVHLPNDAKDIYSGLRVLKYEECLLFSLKTQLIRDLNNQSFVFEKYQIDKNKVDQFISKLEYKLTNDQSTIINEILDDMNKPKLMYRLLQGDVGTGKTLVAELALYANYLRGDQGAFMVPTDALAKQHYKNLLKLFAPLGIKVGLLVGSSSTKERSLIRNALINKEIDIIVGTHILFSKDINYLSLGLAIIDEQHKFGVNQRMLLANKGEHADLLLMSATPIPRTLALTLYGDLDVSTLSEFPHARRKIITSIAKTTDEKIDCLIKRSLSDGRHVFIVAPTIMSESFSKMSVENLYSKYLLKYPGKIALLHGNLDQDDKDFALKDFVSGKSPIIISTSVIEVGIDVPDSNLMIIYDPSHFGLASLHQLRGRIGRDGSMANCVLVYDGNDEEELEKLNVMVSSNDGFKIAEEDLKRRGPGELGGVKQSGLANFTYVNLINDFRMIEASREDAKFILKNKNEPGFRHIIKRASIEIENKKFTNA